MAAIRSKVNLNLGLISMAVDVQSALVSEDSRNKTVASTCTGHDGGEQHPPARITMRFLCPVCERSGNIHEFGKSLIVGNGFAELSAEDMERWKADDSTTRNMSVIPHPAEDFDKLMPSGTVYYLAPSGFTGGSYGLMAQMIEATPHLAYVTVWAARSVNAIYRLTVRDGIICIEKHAYPEDMKAAPSAPDENVNSDLLAVAIQFAEAQVKPFEADTYVSERAAVLEELLATAKVDEGVAAKEPKKAAPKPANDIMSQLRAAIAESKGGKPKATTTTGKKAPTKRVVAKKAPAKRVTKEKAPF